MSDLYPPSPPTEPPPPPPPPLGFGGFPPPGDEPPPPSGPKRRNVVIAVVAVLAVVGLLGAFLLVPEDDDKPSSSDTTTAAAPTTTEQSTSTTAAPGSVEEAVAEISAFVSAQRGLAFKRPVTVELADDDEFQQRLLADLDEDREEIEQTEGILRALGFLDDDTDLFEAVRGLLGGGVVGFYDPETEELVVRGAAPTPYARKTIAHELVHALDDQWFDIDRPQLDDAEDESSFAFSGLVEGNAVRIEEAYAANFTADERRQVLEEELALVGDTDFSAFPLILLETIVAPYQLGPPLVRAVHAQGGEQAVNDAFAAPPTTSEQLLDPQVYLRGEGAVPVALPAAEGEVFDQGVFGAFTLQKMLEQEIPSGRAEDAATGWGGDFYVAWQQGAETCLRATFVGDTPDDTTEIRDGLLAWGSANDADVQGGEDGTPVTLTSCG